MIRRFRTTVPASGIGGRPQPVWRVGSVLKFCFGLSRVERGRVWRLGGVTVNEHPVTAQHVHCRPGDDVRAWYPEATTAVRPEPDPTLHVLYEDAWLLAVAKPPGRLSHPARSEQSGTVANAVAARYRPAGGEPDLVRPVHRLDRDTSGVLLFARDSATASALARQRAAGHLAREYLALVAGRPPAQGEIDLALGPDPQHRTRRRVLLPPGAPPGSHALTLAGFQAAHTAYRVVQYGAAGALVAALLGTGRTHQVRAHFAALGHPLLGDDLYGGPLWPGLQRQALHAWRTRLRHPASGARLTLTAALPEDFSRAARRLLLAPL